MMIAATVIASLFLYIVIGAVVAGLWYRNWETSQPEAERDGAAALAGFFWPCAGVLLLVIFLVCIIFSGVEPLYRFVAGKKEKING